MYSKSYARILTQLAMLLLLVNTTTDMRAATSAGVILIPLIKFETKDCIKGWTFNPWSGKKEASLAFQSGDNAGTPGYIRLKYNQTSATFTNQKFFATNIDKWQKTPIKGFYIRYRVKHLEGKSQYEYSCHKSGNPYNAFNQLGLIRDGQWHILQTTPGGWSKTKQLFSYNDVNSLNLIFHGTGTVDIAEIGITVKAQQQIDLHQAKHILHIPYLHDSEVKIDGNINETTWLATTSLRLLQADGQPISSGNTTDAFLLADDKGLFFSAKCFKANMSKIKANFHANSVSIYNDESIELSIDMERSQGKFEKITMNANGFFGGIRNIPDNSGIIVKSTKYDNRWEVEAFIPWAHLGTKPQTPFLSGINITRNCYDGGKLERSRTGTAKWNAVSDFELAVISPKRSNDSIMNTTAHLYRISDGKYILHSPSAEELFCNIKVWTPDIKAKDFHGKVGNKNITSVAFPILKSGKYHITTLVYNKNGEILRIAEATLSEQSFSSIAPLDINSVALFPAPKVFHLSKSSFHIPEAPTVYLAGDGLDFCLKELRNTLSAFYQISTRQSQLPAEADIMIGLGSQSKMRAALQSAGIEQDFNQIKYDGFIVLVKKEKTLIAAKEKRGLLYGVQAFLDMIKASSSDVGPAVIREAKIIDWPQANIRFFVHAMHSFGPSSRYNPEFYAKMLDNFPMRFRYNGFFFEFGDYYQWKTLEIGNPFAWSKQDYEGIVDFINERYSPVMPFVQSLGHMDWWLLKHEIAASWREDGGKNAFCTRHPDSYKILFGLFQEMLNVCNRNPEYAPRYFHTSLDEIRWQTYSTPEEKRCKHCHNIPKNKIYLDHIIKLNDFIKANNARMLMFSDMLTNDHNGLNEFKCAEILQYIPRDVIMCHWSARDFPSIKPFSEMGFDNWKLLTAYNESSINDKLTKGFGFGVYTYHWWLATNRSPSNSNYGIMAQALTANNFWNGLPDNGSEVWRKTVKQYGNFLMHNWSRKPMPHASTEITPVDISDSINCLMDNDNEWFDSGSKLSLKHMNLSSDNIAGVPTRFSKSEKGASCILLKGGDEATVPIKIRAKAASFILLHAAHLDNKRHSEFYSRKYSRDQLKGKNIAEYTVKYSDGTQTVFQVNYGWNVGEWLINPDIRKDVFAKYLPDARYIWEGKSSLAKEKNMDNDIAIYQYEWINPHPEKKISSILLKHTDSYASYALLALSMRKTIL
jgi:hypothetical protein